MLRWLYREKRFCILWACEQEQALVKQAFLDIERTGVLECCYYIDRTRNIGHVGRSWTGGVDGCRRPTCGPKPQHSLVPIQEELSHEYRIFRMVATRYRCRASRLQDRPENTRCMLCTLVLASSANAQRSICKMYVYDCLNLADQLEKLADQLSIPLLF